MKKVIGFCLAVLVFGNSYSQVALNFCASVESTGNCNFNNNKFISTPDSIHQKVFMEVKSGSGNTIGASVILFKIYQVDSTGQEKFVSMLQQKIQPDWLFAWMPYIFNSPDKFDVKVYNENDQLICSKMFELMAYK